MSTLLNISTRNFIEILLPKDHSQSLYEAIYIWLNRQSNEIESLYITYVQKLVIQINSVHYCDTGQLNFHQVIKTLIILFMIIISSYGGKVFISNDSYIDLREKKKLLLYSWRHNKSKIMIEKMKLKKFVERLRMPIHKIIQPKFLRNCC